MLNIDNKIFSLPIDAIKIHNNKMVFSAGDRVLIKLLRRERVWC